MVARKRKADITIEWAQQSRQMSFLRACGLSHPFEGGGPTEPRADVIGYGGAAGGGKSDALLMAGIVAGLTWPGISVAYFRREFPMLEGPGGAIMRSHELMSGWAKWHGGQRRWTLPTGSILQFCHCKAEEDVFNYQSQQFDIVLIDEATQFLRSQYRYLRTRNRATRDGVIPFMGLATNPGNIGHLWFQSEFVDPGPPEVVHEVEVEPGVFEKHMFIPAFLSDNVILEQRDPGYRQRLEAQPEIVRRQLLHGDWSVFAGQYFKEWRPDIHVVEPFTIPHWWKRFRSLDYGLDCTACYWWAVDQSGRCYVYRELYQPDLILSEAAKRIRELTPAHEHIDYTVASPDLWNRRQDTGVAGYELMVQAGLIGIIRADDRRVPGWRLMREYLKPYTDEQGVEVARLAVFDTCHNLIRTLPALIHDTHNPEDVSDACEDHAPESVRYGIMSRPPLTVEEEERDRRRKWKKARTKPVISEITGY
jgi:phage terminase large subunit